jgi:hypothetical protein
MALRPPRQFPLLSYQLDFLRRCKLVLSWDLSHVDKTAQHSEARVQVKKLHLQSNCKRRSLMSLGIYIYFFPQVTTSLITIVKSCFVRLPSLIFFRQNLVLNWRIVRGILSFGANRWQQSVSNPATILYGCFHFCISFWTRILFIEVENLFVKHSTRLVQKIHLIVLSIHTKKLGALFWSNLLGSLPVRWKKDLPEYTLSIMRTWEQNRAVLTTLSQLLYF